MVQVVNHGGWEGWEGIPERQGQHRIHKERLLKLEQPPATSAWCTVGDGTDVIPGTLGENRSSRTPQFLFEGKHTHTLRVRIYDPFSFLPEETIVPSPLYGNKWLEAPVQT